MGTTLAILLLTTASPAFAETHTGTLEAGDETLEEGEFVDSFRFEAQLGQRFVITMTSDDFDTYLLLHSPTDQVTENDDAGAGSRIELIASEAGTWEVGATSFASGETGDYEVVIEPGAIAKVKTIEGRLDNSDDTALKGEFFDTHTASVPAQGESFVELTSLGFDGFLVVESASGQVWRNDDAGSLTLSRVGPITGGDAGELTIHVTSLDPGEVGAYDLRILTFE
jgi:hypothetical protein